MGVIVDFLSGQGEAIRDRFEARIAAAGGDVTGLRSALPELLAYVAGALGAETSRDEQAPLVHRPPAGAELQRVVLAYATLHDTVLEVLEEHGCSPSIAEQRAIADVVSRAARSVVSRMEAELRDSAQNERRLLERAPASAAYLEAESTRRESEERFRELFGVVDDACCVIEMIFDADGVTPVDYRFLQTNDTFERHTGLLQPVGKTVLTLLPNMDRSWIDRYGQVALSGEPVRFERHASSLGRWFEVFANRVGPAERRRVAIVFKDISERRRLEEEREELLARETAARESAEAASRTKDEFLATISHELRTPLNAMLGWLQMIRTGSLPEDRRDAALETVERNARAQSQLIEDLLDMSRILAGKLRLERELVLPKELVESAVETARAAAEQKGVSLETSLETCDALRGDPHRLQQVLANLLSNAIKFTPPGGRVWVALEQREGEIEILVTDTGKGIDGKFLPRVFDRFRQAEDGSTRSHGGLGLGLAIVRQLVEEHGGTVTAASGGLGRGATFTVRLPAVGTRVPAEAAPRSTQSPVVPELAGARVIAVDDDPDAGEMLAVLLERNGARVTLATSAKDAFDLVRSQRPALLLSDISMPDHDGYDLIGWVRGLPESEGGRVPAIAITAFARSSDRTKALTRGFDNYVTKPIDTAELMLVIGAVLQREGHDH